MVNQPNSDQEIDLAHVSRKLRGALSSANNTFFDGILYLKRNILWLLLIIAGGVALGMYMDRTKVYETKMFVIPNFGSVDYLYSQVGLINSKIKEDDSAFIKSAGFDDNVAALKIEPIVDYATFLETEEGEQNKNYEMLKLMAESNDIETILEDGPTVRYYKTHVITVTTVGPTNKKGSVDAVLSFLNNSPYYKEIQAEAIKGLETKITVTDSTLKQIDAILNDNGKASAVSKGNIMYYNDNTPLHEVIRIKNKLTAEQAENKLERINYQSIVRESGTVINNKDTKGLRGKMKFIVPLVLLSLFLILSVMIKYYKWQMAKRRAAAL